MAPGASSIRTGEAGKGLASRWYPETIARRIRDIASHAHRIQFHESDGMKTLGRLAWDTRPGTAVFADPPYTAAGKRADRRLYNQ